MTASFLFAAVILILLPIAFIFPALLKRRQAAPAKLTASVLPDMSASRNLVILREQLAELEKERAQGLLNESDFTEAREDLERRLIEENTVVNVNAGKIAGQDKAQNEAQANARNPSPLAAALLAFLLVAGGFSGYFLLGNPASLFAGNSAAPDASNEPGNGSNTAAVEAMANLLEQRLKENPQNEEGWLMLATAYKTLNRPADAAAAYAKIEKRVSADADLLTDYAEALALAAMPQKPDDKPSAFLGKPRSLLKQALKLEPGHAKALFLAGAAAFESGDKREAADYWEKLLPNVEANSELHELLTTNIERIRSEKAAEKKRRN